MTRYLLGNRQRAARRQQLALLRLERRFRPIVQAEIARASNAMIGQFASSGSVRGDDRHAAEMERIYKQMYAGSVEAIGGEIITQGKSAGKVEQRKDFTQHFARMAMEFFSAWGATRVTQVSETTKDIIRRIVARGYRDGLGQRGIADMLRNVVPMTYANRAETIARTETHSAASYGAHEAAIETGLQLQKEWVTAFDERARADHVAANGQRREMDAPFLVGGEELMHPGDPAGSAANVINCRCVEAHIVLD